MIFKRLVKKRIAFSLLLFLFLQLYAIPYTLYPTHAAESTPSANVKSKLEELKKEIASKAAKYKETISKKLKNRAYAGTIKSKSQSSLTLASGKGPRIVNINQDTRFESKIKPKAKISLKTLDQEDYLAALGDIDETGVLTAIKIILLPARPAGGPTTNYQLKTYLWGQVVSISDKLVTVKLKDAKNLSVSLPKGPKVKLNDYLILSGSLGNNEIYEARFLHIVPSSAKPSTAR